MDTDRPADPRRDTGALRPLVLTGGPAAGKSTTGRRLAGRRARGAHVDVDDIRQLVVGGHRAPWEGAEGARQQLLGVRNACALARSLAAAGVAVVLTDVLDPRTAAVYRDELPGCLVVHLVLDPAEALRRASTRRPG